MTGWVKLVLAVALFLLAGCSCYSAAFHAWMTATPLTPEQVVTHQWLFYCFIAAAVLAFLASVVVLAWPRKQR